MSFLLLIALPFFGSYNISGIVNPRNTFFSSADQEALHWIESNISPNSTILINSYPWDGEYEPTDGGGWISYLSGRKTIFPRAQSEYDEIEDLIYHSNIDFVYLGTGYGDLTPLNINRAGKTFLYKKNGIYIYGVNK